MACPVCFGGDDLAIRESLNAGIGILLGVTAVVLGAFLRFFIRLAKRSREYAHLVENGGPENGVGGHLKRTPSKPLEGVLFK
jgi:hypothetical protein